MTFLYSIITSLAGLQQTYILVFNRYVLIDGSTSRTSVGFTWGKESEEREAQSLVLLLSQRKCKC